MSSKRITEAHQGYRGEAWLQAPKTESDFLEDGHIRVPSRGQHSKTLLHWWEWPSPSAPVQQAQSHLCDWPMYAVGMYTSHTPRGVAATGHTPTPSCFRATFRVGGEGGGWVWWGGLGGQLEGGWGAPDPYTYGLKWPSHRVDHLEVQM